MPALDPKDPEQWQLALDRRTAGVGPTMAPRSWVRERRKLWDARVAKIQEDRREEIASASKAVPLTPVEQLERLRKMPPAPPRRPPMTALMMPLGISPERRPRVDLLPYPKKTSQRTVKPVDPFDGMILGSREAAWSDASTTDDDEAMPDAPPRWNVSKRRANDMVIATCESFRAEVEEEERRSATLRERHVPWASARLAMAEVATQIIIRGAEKQRAERHEIGPAQQGFEYINIGNDVYLTRTDGNGSTMFIAPADTVRILLDCRNNLHHEMRRPPNVGDLQPGERYQNMNAMLLLIAAQRLADAEVGGDSETAVIDEERYAQFLRRLREWRREEFSQRCR
ncbi:hypothetical protein C8J57DRAFT_1515537 [Mycena rebaudengoi]|nr:hypothetical protein C8J57DRAFT_1515537 [Mycena rebaudengoi]